MAQEEENEVTSRITSTSSCSTSIPADMDMHDMFKELMAKFEEIQASHEILLNENFLLKSDINRLKKELEGAKPMAKAFIEPAGNPGRTRLGFKSNSGKIKDQGHQTKTSTKPKIAPGPKVKIQPKVNSKLKANPNQSTSLSLTPKIGLTLNLIMDKGGQQDRGKEDSFLLTGTGICPTPSQEGVILLGNPKGLPDNTHNM
ncbi:hypothetical protein Dimus_037968 [Dionaea muscipula]